MGCKFVFTSLCIKDLRYPFYEPTSEFADSFLVSSLQLGATVRTISGGNKNTVVTDNPRCFRYS